MTNWIRLLPLISVAACIHVPVDEKLNASITAISSTAGNSGVYEIDYTLSWIAPAGRGTSVSGWRLQPAELVYVRLWEGGMLLNTIPVPIGLSKAFLARSDASNTSEIYVNQQGNADSVSITLSRSTLITSRLVLPPMVWP